MARPGGAQALRNDLASLVSIGVDGLVSMLPPDEASRLGLGHEATIAADLGLEFRSVPVVDFGVPDDDLADASAWIRALLSTDAHVVVHCHGGIGRSSMLAAAVLVDDGFDADAAWAAIGDARGRPVPDNEAQRVWLGARYAADPA